MQFRFDYHHAHCNGVLNTHINGPCESSHQNCDSIAMPVSHYSDVIMSAIASQITGVAIVSSTVCSGADQRKHQSSTPLAFVREIHRWSVNSPHKGSVTRKMFPFYDVIMSLKEEEAPTAMAHAVGGYCVKFLQYIWICFPLSYPRVYMSYTAF